MQDKTSKEIEQMRHDFLSGQLDESDIPQDPWLLFERWIGQALAASVNEPNAMALATCDMERRPSLRTVLLRGYDREGIRFFTNYESRKGKNIEDNPQVALLFFWAELERQIRIEGRTVKTTTEESDSYFEGRPPGNRLGAWASPQSKIIRDRKELEERVEHFTLKFGTQNIKRPGNWGGYRVIPTSFEFWQGRESRLHDRILYSKENETWSLCRLAP